MSLLPECLGRTIKDCESSSNSFQQMRVLLADSIALIKLPMIHYSGLQDNNMLGEN